MQQIEVELPRPQLPPFGDAGHGDAVKAYAAQVVEAMQKREDVRTFFDRPK